MDLRQANREGWSIQMLGVSPVKIICVRGYSLHVGGPATDQEADAFVRAKASAGSAYHIEALAYVAFTEPRGFGFKATYNPTIYSRIQKI